MKSRVLLLIVFAASLLYAQYPESTARPDLSKFTSAQLSACFHNFTICGTDNETIIAGELVARLPHFSTNELIMCFSEWRICGADSFTLTDEIVRRGHPDLLIARYWKETDNSIREGILQVVSHFHSDDMTDFMRKVLAEKKGDDEFLYWPANYLAKLCDPDALQWLSSRKGRSEGCLQFAGTISVFGRCKYRPAVPYLIKYSMNDACLNIVDDAETDLRSLYPHSPKEFKSIEEMQQYFCGRAKQEGFKIHCAAH
jgi:hypothetical protein